MIIFLVLGVLFAFCLKFPGMSICYAVSQCLADINPDVWIMWWADSVSDDSTPHAMGYWLGLYAFFSVLPLIAVSLWVA
jgi:hypothetical protein